MGMRLVIEGQVQGVGYRAWAEGQAMRLGLSGWVRNRRDGCVEILAHGTDEALTALEKACGRGPPAASVTRVTRTAAAAEAGAGFLQRETI